MRVLDECDAGVDIDAYGVSQVVVQTTESLDRMLGNVSNLSKLTQNEHQILHEESTETSEIDFRTQHVKKASSAGGVSGDSSHGAQIQLIELNKELNRGGGSREGAVGLDELLLEFDLA